MAGIARVILDKLEELALLSGPRRPFSHRRPRSPAALLDATSELANLVDLDAIESFPRPGSLDTRQVADLFAFLANPPRNVQSAMARLDSFSDEPMRASQEPRADIFWQIAALVQDVWEHAFGPETEDDSRILTLLHDTGGRTLDYGSGAGYFAFWLARSGHEVTCVEPSPVKRRFLEFRCARHPEGRRISLAPPRGRYDLLLAINVLDHLRSPVTAIRQLSSHAAAAGKLICCAVFPGDGWHTGGGAVRDSVYRELLRHFRYPADRRQSEQKIVVLERRVRPRGSNSVTFPAPSRFRLHPAAVFAPYPGDADRLVIYTPRFYTRPLVVAQSAVALLHAWREPRTWQEALGFAAAVGVARDEAVGTLQMLRHARLLVPVEAG